MSDRHERFAMRYAQQLTDATQPYNFRGHRPGSQKDTELGRSLATIGQKSPLVVSERADGTMVLLCGHRRIAAVDDDFIFDSRRIKGLTRAQELEIVIGNSSGRSKPRHKARRRKGG